MGTIFSLAAFAASFLYGRQSLGAGMAVVLAVGYFYAIVRANFLDGFSHFFFDGAVLGLYLARLTLPNALAPPYATELSAWVRKLIVWPFVVLGLGAALVPQHILIQLVGLRTAIWFLPFLLLGASARSEDLNLIARTLAILNLVALVFAVGEYFLGLGPFFPRNAVTRIMYISKDIAGMSHHRIPSTFLAAAAYGGVMVTTIPWLVGRWQMPGVALLERCLFIAALLAAVLGIFMCGSRTPVIYLFILGAFLAYHLRVKGRYLVPALGMAVLVGYIVSGNERFQRFTLLKDTDDVTNRIHGSTNVGVIETFTDYPLGTGLGRAAGTSIPSFLEHLITEKFVGAENEYCRLWLEVSPVGLMIWLGFLVWFVAQRHADPPPEWKLGCKLMFLHTFICWGTAFIGTGMLSSIPQTAMLLFQMGVLARDRFVSIPVRQPTRWDRGRIVRRGDTSPAQTRREAACLFPG